MPCPKLKSKSFVFQCAILLFCWNQEAFCMTAPKINIDGYALADSFQTWNTNFTENEIPLGSGGNATTFVVPSAIRGLSLICNASYPVEWTFHREKWNQRTNWQATLQNTRGSDPLSLEPLWFSVEIRFLGSQNEITGNYTCQKYGQPRISSSVYVFWEGSSPPYLTLLQGGTHRRKILFDPKNYNSFVIPCTVSRPDIAVQLTKIDKDNTTQDISMHDNVGYDAAVGFTVTKADGEDPFGVYTCVVGEPDDDDSLEFEVKPTNGKGPVVPEFEDFILGNTASFSYNATKRQFVCCSSSNKPPKIGHFYCSHPITCQLQKHALHKIETSPRSTSQDNCAFLPLRALIAGVLRCKGDHIDIVREYFFPMMQTYQRFYRSNTTSDMMPYFSWEEAESDKMMTLTNLTDPFYVGDKKRFICRASRFYFAQGIHWVVKYDNQTIFVQGNQTQVGKKHPFGIFQQGNYAVMELNADIGLQSLTCKAPIWNTTTWGDKTLSFNIKLPTSPKIEGDAEEDKTFSPSSQTKLLKCSYSGIPNPKVTWKSNGKVLRGSFINVTETWSTLNITKSNFVQVTYICNVTNPGGNVKKIFRVYISDGLSGWKITLYVAGAIMFIVAGVGGIFAFRIMRAQTETIRHLANVAFKDVNDVASATQPDTTRLPVPENNASLNGNGANGTAAHQFGSQNQPFQEGNTASEFGRYQKM